MAQLIWKAGILSDVQGLPSEHDWGMHNYRLALELLKEQGIDMLFTLGDISEGGNPQTYALFWKIMDDIFGAGKLCHFGCEGNHDIGNGRKTGLEEAFHRVCSGLRRPAENPCLQNVGGIDVIAFAARDGMIDYREEDLHKLEKMLQERTAARPGKPVLLLTHLPPARTMSGSACGSEELRSVLDRYPEVISLSGHTHYPLEDERCIWQGAFTALTTSTLAYACTSEEKCFNNVNGISPYAREAAQCMMMELYEDELIVHRYHVLDHREIGTPWRIALPYSPAAAVYTAARRETREAPEFPAGAKLLTRYDYGYMYLGFDRAEGKDFAQFYDVELSLRQADGSFAPAETVRYLADFYRCRENQARQVFIKLPGAGMKSDADYRIRVYPVESFGKRGKPLEILEHTWTGYTFKDGHPQYPQE